MSEATQLKAMPVLEAMQSRRSVRAFLGTSIDKKVITQILEAASRAPSGTNMQPWKTYVLTGSSLADLCETVSDAFDKRPTGYDSEMRYYPEQWFEPYKTRRRKIGLDLYGLLDIKKGDKQRMHEQHRRNFLFFNACLLYTSPSPRDGLLSRMPSSA